MFIILRFVARNYMLLFGELFRFLEKIRTVHFEGKSKRTVPHV